MTLTLASYRLAALNRKASHNRHVRTHQTIATARGLLGLPPFIPPVPPPSLPDYPGPLTIQLTSLSQTTDWTSVPMSGTDLPNASVAQVSSAQNPLAAAIGLPCVGIGHGKVPISAGPLAGDTQDTQPVLDWMHANLPTYTRFFYGDETTNTMATLQTNLNAFLALNRYGATVLYIPTGTAIDNNWHLGASWNTWMSTPDAVLYQSQYLQDDPSYIPKVVTNLNNIVTGTGGKPYGFQIQTYSKNTGLVYSSTQVINQLNGVINGGLIRPPYIVSVWFNNGATGTPAQVIASYATLLAVLAHYR